MHGGIGWQRGVVCCSGAGRPALKRSFSDSSRRRRAECAEDGAALSEWGGVRYTGHSNHDGNGRGVGPSDCAKKHGQHGAPRECWVVAVRWGKSNGQRGRGVDNFRGILAPGIEQRCGRDRGRGKGKGLRRAKAARQREGVPGGGGPVGVVTVLSAREGGVKGAPYCFVYACVRWSTESNVELFHVLLTGDSPDTSYNACEWKLCQLAFMLVPKA
ncbi:hypothetical protein R3P38DRAFT_3347251 [Favolaschia claudopus]|uniref:Uncharacterized protein n=1 Tax=Favolaschia claudopus TaxID=2862362 RepID=A0AAW0D349_9AGAR